jgi:hypothetical protein
VECGGARGDDLGREYERVNMGARRLAGVVENGEGQGEMFWLIVPRGMGEEW